MGRKRRGERSAGQTTGPGPGTWEISTGTAELVADDFLDDAWTLQVNGVPSSHVVLGRPRELAFEYMRWIAAFTEEFVHSHLDPDALRVTHLGGAACTMARYFADVWPRSRHTVVELDAKLADLVREWFDIPRAPTVKIRVGEARAETAGFVPASRDVIIRDVFSGAVTPRPLTTVEFFRAAHASLAPGGLYVANCGDHSDLTGARAELAGMAEVFDHLSVIADPPMLKGRRYGNIILIGSDRELPVEGSPEAATIARSLLGGAVPAHLKDEDWTRRFLSGTRARHDGD
ncbi:spermidine synthase [Corynebacterium halotolerans]|uniref:Spermidine synthase n=1 Tax=Corynebacterium halotolerans YIM 70093 = DSM 44683 TaxID=1121362 RepID=M1MWY6_9CORY|nr:fused MFS/spermidine synthase [Corynebacterium halotolerans]AGF72264.1 spermidine synthase [Corynebacterium halotolerans YIM 70093 = DSM 44683]